MGTVATIALGTALGLGLYTLGMAYICTTDWFMSWAMRFSDKIVTKLMKDFEENEKEDK